MNEPLRCGYCGARVDRGAERCAYCGTSAAETPDEVLTAGPRTVDFRRLDEHPDYPHMLALLPGRGRVVRRHLTKAAFFVVFTGVTAFVAWQSRAESGLPHVAPLLFCALGLFLLASAAWELARSLLLPVRAVGAGVVDARLGSEEAPGHRFVKLVLRGGGERRWSAPGRGQDWKPGDVGVAYLLGERLLEFRRLPSAGAA